jgi:hypothetical protein
MQRPSWRPAAVLTVLVVGLAGCGESCGTKVLCALHGPINDPSNFTLRRAILSQGLSNFCHQMVAHNAPLKMTNDSPVIGRFYPQHCTTQELKGGDLYVQFDGFGYGYTNLSRKLTFTMQGAVEYDQDFRVSEPCSIYAFFRSKKISSANFQTHVVEQPVASFLNSVTQLGDNFGRQLVSGKLGEGFTVIMDPQQNVDFAVGMVALGQHPMHPFDVHGTDRLTYENLRTEVHQGERDFIGPIEITESNRAIYVSATVDGAAGVTLYLMDKQSGDVSLGLYYNYPQIGPLNAPVLVKDNVNAGRQYTRSIPVQKGMYYVVLENPGNPVAAPSLLPMPMTDIAATVSYAVQIGDAP